MNAAHLSLNDAIKTLSDQPHIGHMSDSILEEYEESAED